MKTESYVSGHGNGTRDAKREAHQKVYRAARGGYVWRVDDLPEEYEPNEWAAGYCDAFDAAMG